jgi:pyrimidine-nucleoside phosphorylase
LIRKTRDGVPLDEPELRFMVFGALIGALTEAQIGAWLMAITLRGLTEPETFALTQAFVDSGRCLDLAGIPGVTVDKHSTGGVGDKTTLVVVPLVAAAGVTVLKLSGRGLGFTGGTLDKLEAIPGFRTDLDEETLLRQAREISCAIAAPSAELAPADKIIYGIRDTTATVESLPLIASSVMSKKLAAGAAAFVFDVKFGRGAIMKDPDGARALALLLNELAVRAGKRSVALLTSMEQPLGAAVGNALEVAEAIRCLRGEGPADLTEICLALGSEMVVLGQRAASLAEARCLLERCLRSGAAAEQFARLVSAQAGDAAVLDDPDLLPRAPLCLPVVAAADGYVATMDTQAIGEATVRLGAGRVRPAQPIDPRVGVVFRARIGDPVRAGDLLAEIHAADAATGAAGVAAITAAVTICPERSTPPPLIRERLAAESGTEAP